MIKVVRVSDKGTPGFKRVYCGRPGKGVKGPLGNPFWMNSEADRNIACDLFEAHMFEAVRSKGKGNMELYLALKQLYKDAKAGNIELACFCAPKRCHCDSIKAFIESHLYTVRTGE